MDKDKVIDENKIIDESTVEGVDNPTIKLGTLTEQDYNYISNISKKQKELSLKIGTLEIEKSFLLKDFTTLFEQQQGFEDQLCEKYGFPKGLPFKIDAERNVLLINE